MTRYWLIEQIDLETGYEGSFMGRSISTLFPGEISQAYFDEIKSQFPRSWKQVIRYRKPNTVKRFILTEVPFP